MIPLALRTPGIIDADLAFPLHCLAAFGPFLAGVLLTWLYNSTGGSILVVAVWHGLFDYVTACIDCKSGLIAVVLSMVVMVWAALIPIVCRGTNLSRAEKLVL